MILNIIKQFYREGTATEPDTLKQKEGYMFKRIKQLASLAFLTLLLVSGGLATGCSEQSPTPIQLPPQMNFELDCGQQIGIINNCGY